MAAIATIGTLVKPSPLGESVGTLFKAPLMPGKIATAT